MLSPTTRRTLLLAAASLPLASACSALARPGQDAARAAFTRLEADLGGRLGVFAIDTADGATLGHRADERFAMASSFKAILAAAMLARSVQEPALLQRLVRYTERDLLPHSPVTGQHVAQGMTVAALCAATVQYSDNAAANLLLEVLGGPAALTAYTRTLGDTQFRLDRTEPALNSAQASDPRDTTTPQAMARTLRTLVLGDALPAPQRAQFKDWLLGNTTGGARIRAGVPAGWAVGDKTGTGNHGAASDIGVVWPPGRAPLVVVVYTWREAADAKAREDVIADATRVVVGWIG
ncbi:class A beta-lactamase [Pseudorhodoferax sp. Leaf267]|uniref:class A beta-lactamase n=1 Tax=Pseudorhodoferax sp. Leaf267 TaxID=1736316 RepID=UPI0006F6BE1A|nr:class A beta-lactamase [Pseudorhodoferax sp. Leaf267]KQP12288.1 class A beta-lactamase [Pseudorhodoferax sp. Leaf267]